MRGYDGTLYLSEKDRAKLWKAHMSKIMNEWDKRADADTVEGPIERVIREEIVEAFKYLMIGKAPGLTGLCKIISSSGDVEIGVLMEHCHGILDGNGIPIDWATNVVFPVFKGKWRYHELWNVYGCKTTKTCNENCYRGT